MLYVVAYDVASDRRREAVARALEAIGDRVQQSVFLIDIDGTQLARLLDALDAELEPPADRLQVWRICAGCERASHVIGPTSGRSGEITWIL